MGRPLSRCLLFVAVLCLPAVQSLTGLVPRRPLGGVEDERPSAPAASWSTWLDGTLQQHWRDEFVRGLGLRDWLVRADNQLRMALTGDAKGKVTAGADGWLFASEYLPGVDLATPELQRSVLLTLANLRRLQTRLDELGVSLWLLISPNKSRLYPEHLPRQQRAVAEAAVPSAYEFARPFVQESGLRCFDAQALFARWRAEGVDFPLFTRGGAHWSAYASARVAALLLDEMAGQGVPVRQIDVERGAPGPWPQEDEGDLVAMANLLDERPWHEATPVPRVRVRAAAPLAPAPILIEGTSFVWGLLRHLVEQRVGSPLSFLYYLNTRHDYVDGRATAKRRVEWAPDELPALRAELLRHRVIVIEINAKMLPTAGHGLIQGMLMLLGESPRTELDAELSAYCRRHGRRQ